jgi:hypothetical protein
MFDCSIYCPICFQILKIRIEECAIHQESFAVNISGILSNTEVRKEVRNEVKKRGKEKRITVNNQDQAPLE